MINNKDYILPEKNFNKVETNKKRIVIGNSFSIDMNHYIGWLNRYNGKYQKTAAYTIKLDGTICQHFDPKYYSIITNDEEFDKSTILVILENEGWLSKDLNNENKYITYNGNIYNRVDEVFIKKWRSNRYWAPYTQEQMESSIYLVNKLCDEFEIPKNIINHNTKIYNGYNYEGVLYKSNLNNFYTDVNPSWDFLNFKEQIETI
jgi:hypothetical protein